MQARRRGAGVLNKSSLLILSLAVSSAVAVVIAFASGGMFACSERAPECHALVAKADWLTAEPSCRAAWEKRGRVEDLVDLAQALLYQARNQEVATLLRPAAADVPRTLLLVRLHWILGAALARLDQPAEARHHLELSLQETELEGDAAPLRARAALELAGVEWRAGQLAAAHEYQRLAAHLAAATGDAALTAFARLGLVDILRVEGDIASAELELEQLARSAAAQPDRAVFLLKLGLAYNDLGIEGLSRGVLAEALKLERSSRAPRATILASILLNLSWVERNSGHAAESLAHVAAAEQLGADAMDVHLNRGLALRDGGRLDEAALELARAGAAQPTGDWIWWLRYNQGDVDIRRHQPREAEGHLRAAIAAIEEQRAASSRTAPMMSARQRTAYTALIGVLARQQRWRDALAVVQRLDDAELLQLLGSASGASRPAATEPPAAASAPRVATPSAAPSLDELLAAWADRRLIILVPGGERMWRLVLEGGEVFGRDVGETARFESAAAELERDASALPASQLLGEAITGDLPGAPRSLELLSVGPIGRAPLASLRDRDGLLRDRFALSRALRLTPRPAPAAAAPRPAVVLGDPSSDLAQARAEAEHVARLLGVAPRLGNDATSRALDEARAASVLHLAAHTMAVEKRPALRLADRAVLLDELRALRPAPRLVVLGTCGSASARDETSWGSLASAFLEAGSEHVLATTQSVPDADGKLVVEEFYRQGGLTDPAGALAAAQRALDGQLPASRLAAFMILRAPPPRRQLASPPAPAPRAIHRDGLNTSDRSLMSIPSKRK